MTDAIVISKADFDGLKVALVGSQEIVLSTTKVLILGQRILAISKA